MLGYISVKYIRFTYLHADNCKLITLTLLLILLITSSVLYDTKYYILYCVLFYTKKDL